MGRDETGAVRDLLGVDPEDFVQRRKELARELREDGDRDAAARLLAMRKPPLHLWAVNHFARHG
jgi:hypothetical protein